MSWLLRLLSHSSLTILRSSCGWLWVPEGCDSDLTSLVFSLESNLTWEIVSCRITRSNNLLMSLAEQPQCLWLASTMKIREWGKIELFGLLIESHYFSLIQRHFHNLAAGRNGCHFALIKLGQGSLEIGNGFGIQVDLGADIGLEVGLYF